MKLSVYAARFYHHISLPLQQVGVLRMEVARRLGVDASSLFALVKEGDTLVEVDEDISDGLVLDVFLREVSTFFLSYIYHLSFTFIIFHLHLLSNLIVSETNVPFYFSPLPYLLLFTFLQTLQFEKPLL